MSETATRTAVLETPGGKDLSGKYLTFKLGKEEFGIEILKVREIIGSMTTTFVPGAPEHITGVINLRGKIIPVMDLRQRFKMTPEANNNRNCIIVVEIDLGDKTADMGLLVDMVSEVMNIGGNEIEPAPELGMSIDTSYILGLAKSGPDVKILIDISRMLNQWHYLALAQADGRSAE